MSTPNMNAQKSFKAHEAFAKAHPEWVKLAMAPIKEWGTGEVTLPHAIAKALQEAYEMGKAGKEPAETRTETRTEAMAPKPNNLLRRRR